MNLSSCLIMFGLDEYSTIEDVKHIFRLKSIQVHPDSSEEIDSKKFIELKSAYDFLITNHVPKKRPSKAPLGKVFTFYRILSDGRTNHSVSVPSGAIQERPIVLMCIWRDAEFRVVLNQGDRLPKTIEITNVGKTSITMKIEES